MNLLSSLRNLLADDRFTANLLATYSVIVVIVIVSLFLRRVLTRGASQLARRTGLMWLDLVGKEAARRGRRLLLWVTLTSVFLITVVGFAYHLIGRDFRQDVGTWYDRLTLEDVLQVGFNLGAVVVLGLCASCMVRGVHRLRPKIETRAAAWLGRAGNEATLHRWFLLLERFVSIASCLAALWGAGRVVGFGDLADNLFGLLLRIVTILSVARLLTLGCGPLLWMVAELGDRHLGQGQFHRYWERIVRLVPFGQRCFEAAVYISAASLCVGELHFIAKIDVYGPRVVECIGIFFLTRVLIELLQVLLHEAFGLYDEHRKIDQKGRTLVPLLHSLCQYVLYFGSTVVMLDVLGINTQPILAGAGILGLAVGLGAQNLVTDVVSGFFILFENQYLVGDFVKIGEAAGTVEAVGIRLTQVRDEHGKLHLIPNGQIKGVISYSKGYINAVVDVRIPAGNDLETVFRAMTEAGRRLRELQAEVLAETQIQGLIEWGTSEMTVRAVTKVQPGTHLAMQNEYRRLLKQVFDHKQSDDRTALAA
jgi:small-conductance mechanosensitive channel